ncbi:RNA-directed DNA polymerase from mobile element jockey [Araneus ventricosus]|uniref:RNA-directed DNA polymerase from mobile element jockey n=1 Tax=Araneus ventricosus TaxID=182803 RepID=A0A4Y2U6H4_ARAVE|nr:RNA-directed DNA polymerase from mobile element jockey [Araneus ventricosus]
MKNFSTGNATSINDLSSDHNPVAFDININSNLSSSSKNINITNWKTFCQLIHNSIPGNPKMDTEAEIDEAIQKFTCCITSAINLSTRTKVISGPFRQLPKEILTKIKIKNRLRKLYQITFFPPYKRKAYKLQKEIQKDIETYDNNRWKETIMDINPEDNTLYEMNRKLSKKFIPTPPILDTDGIKYTPLGKANAFKHSLENSFQENPEPYCNLHINEVNNSINSYFNNLATFSTPDLISSQEVINLIKKINPRKATGPDGVPNKAIRMLTLNAVTHLTKIFNKCLILQHFPDAWKIAHVLMFPKPNQNRKHPGSYRPISLLSNIGKLYEKILLKRLNDHCYSNNIIPDEQFGFRDKHSCTHQLLRVTNKIVEGFNIKHYTRGVFLDVSKAFDRMWHNGLIVKLINYQFPDYLIKIIQRFLSNRKFQVKINQVLSSVGNIQAGTPQGSSLSPTLYNIFNSDFPRNDKVLNCLFADDSAILTQGSNTRFIIKTLQSQLECIEYWCTKWRVAINTDKTKAILFRKGHSRKVLKTLSFMEEDLPWENQVKYLGLILDSKLSFRQHAKYNSDKFWNKVHMIIPLIGRHSPLSLNNKVLLFKQILRPILTYSAPIWCITAKTHRRKIQILQNKILRIMTNAPWFVRNDVIHKDLKIELIEDHVKNLSRKFFSQLQDHKNPLINGQVEYAHTNGKYPYPYSTTKWSLPIKPP